MEHVTAPPANTHHSNVLSKHIKESAQNRKSTEQAADRCETCFRSIENAGPYNRPRRKPGAGKCGQDASAPNSNQLVAQLLLHAFHFCGVVDAEAA